MVGRSEPKVLAAVLENGADLRIRHLEGETGIVLEQNPFRSPVIAVHSLPDDVQENGRCVHRIEYVDVALHQPGLVPDGGGQFLPSAVADVEDAQLSHAGHPILPVPGVDDVIDQVRSGVGGHQGEIIGIVAVEDRSAGGDDPEQVAVHDGVRETEGVQVADDRTEAVGLFVIEIQGGGVARQDPAVGSLPETVDVPAVAQDGNPAETAFVRADGDAVRGSDPEPALLAVEDGIDLVVRQAQRIVGAEILMVVVDGILVQAAGGGDPDVAVAVLGKGVHPLVGDAVGDHEARVSGRNGGDPVPAARQGQQDEQGI